MKSILLIKTFLELVEMTFGLAHMLASACSSGKLYKLLSLLPGDNLGVSLLEIPQGLVFFVF